MGGQEEERREEGEEEEERRKEIRKDVVANVDKGMLREEEKRERMRQNKMRLQRD